MRELRERAEPALRILCLVLAGVVLYELAGMVIRWNPFHGTTVPELPALASATNTAPSVAHGSNVVATTMGIKGTNSAAHLPATNSILTVSVPGTNLNTQSPPAPPGTGLLVSVKSMAVTNGATNIIAKTVPMPGATNDSSDTVLTNGKTNLLLSASGTNAAAKEKKKKSGASSMPGMAGMNFNPFGPSGRHGPDLPPAIQARISKITDSEILGPVMRPLPMGLLGIAGNVAFLRSDTGQTGLVKLGDTLDDIKLLRIGVNRVLIEQNGEKKELTIFSGYGGESLLQTDSTNENKNL